MDATAERNPGSLPDRPCGDLLRPYHVRVVLRLVALVGDVVEHHIHGPADDDLAFNLGHAVPFPDLQPSTAIGDGCCCCCCWNFLAPPPCVPLCSDPLVLALDLALHVVLGNPPHRFHRRIHRRLLPGSATCHVLRSGIAISRTPPIRQANPPASRPVAIHRSAEPVT